MTNAWRGHDNIAAIDGALAGLQKITVTVFRGGSQVLSLEDYKVDR